MWSSDGKSGFNRALLPHLPSTLNREIPKGEPKVAPGARSQPVPPSPILRIQWLERATELFPLYTNQLTKGWRNEEDLDTNSDVTVEVVEEEEGA